jgi:hypothetical protein
MRCLAEAPPPREAKKYAAWPVKRIGKVPAMAPTTTCLFSVLCVARSGLNLAAVFPRGV